MIDRETTPVTHEGLTTTNVTNARASDDASADRAIAEAASSGRRDEAADLLVQHYAEAVGRVCMALLGAQHAAERAMEHTLLTALDDLVAKNSRPPLRVWLLGIARRRCARDLANAGSEPQRETKADAEPRSVDGDGANRARRLLCVLRPTERDAVVLCAMGGLSAAGAAAACGIDAAEARKRLSRALARLGDATAKGGG